jgi:hypothetical protein
VFCLYVPNASCPATKFEISFYAFRTENRSRGKWDKYPLQNTAERIKQELQVYFAYTYLPLLFYLHHYSLSSLSQHQELKGAVQVLMRQWLTFVHIDNHNVNFLRGYLLVAWKISPQLNVAQFH